MNSRRKRAFRRNIVAHCRRRRPRSTPYVKSPSMPRRRLLLFRRRMTRARSAHASPPPRPHSRGWRPMHAYMRSDIRHHRTRDRPSPVIRSIRSIRSMDHARVCFRSDIRHHIRTTCPQMDTHWRVMTRNESLMPRSHAVRARRARAILTRARDTHTTPFTMSAFTQSAAFGKVSIKAKATTTTRYV